MRAYLDPLTDADLEGIRFPATGPWPETSLRYILYRAITHHYFHIGKVASKRARLRPLGAQRRRLPGTAGRLAVTPVSDARAPTSSYVAEVPPSPPSCARTAASTRSVLMGSWFSRRPVPAKMALLREAEVDARASSPRPLAP